MKAVIEDITQREIRCAIFCSPTALDIVKVALRVYKYASIDLEIQLVTPQSFTCNADLENIVSEFGISICFDETIEGFKEVKNFLEKNKESFELRKRSWKWYLQQYLKLAFAWKTDRMVFIHDGDTIFSPRLLRQLSQKPVLLTTRENVDIYLLGIKLLGLPESFESYIANGGIFDPLVLQELSLDPSSWFIEAVKTCVFNSDANASDFSEYQIMGSLLRGRLKSQKLKIFRRFDLLVGKDIRKLNYLNLNESLKKYDAVALEMFHQKNLTKRIIAKCLYNLDFSW
jgi:hypothetical protein